MAIQRGLLASHRSRSGRNSFSLLTVDLNLGDLGRFLRRTISTFSADANLTNAAIAACDSLLARINQSYEESDEFRIDDSNEELKNCMSILFSFLASPVENLVRREQLPSSVVYEAHALIGCVQETLKQHKLSSISFLKALWIASVTPTIATEQLALTLHRLGCSYTAVGTYTEAQSLLEKAVANYTTAGVHRNHAVVVEAREMLSWIEKKLHTTDPQTSSSASGVISKRWSSASARTLSLIHEEAEPAERRMSM